jgi:hypothetical protein
MNRQFFFALIAGVLLVAAAIGISLWSNRSVGNDPPDEAIKLTADEVAALLGIKGRDDLKIGAVESGREGVKVKSLSLKENGSVEVEIQDIGLQIKRTSKLRYSLIALRIGKVDILDWSTTQRVRAYGIRIDQPGDRFLTKLQTAIAAVRAGGCLRTADLACARLAIDGIDYEMRSKDATLTRVRLESVALNRAASETIGELSVAGLGIGDAVAAKGFRVRRVDRLWADQMLALLVTLSRTNSSAPLSPKPEAAPRPTPPSTALAKRLLPSDRLALAEINVDLGKLVKEWSGKARLHNLHIDVQRGSHGEFAGLLGGFDVEVATKVFGEEGKRFFHEMGNRSLEESLTGSAKIRMVLDPVRRAERSSVSISAPGLMNLSVTATTRHLAELLGKLLAQEAIPEGLVTMSSFTVEGHDGGLLAFLLSKRPTSRAQREGGELVRDVSERIALQQRDASQISRLRKEVRSFLRSPKSFTWSATSKDFIAANEFMKEMNANSASAVAKHFSCISGPLADVAIPSPDVASVREDYAEFRKDAKGSYIWVNAFDRIDAWMQAAQAGNPLAQVLVGHCYERGRGVQETDYAEAMRWYRKAANAGNTFAMRQMGHMIEYGRVRPPKDGIAEAIRWYRRAANAGDVEAMNDLGYEYARPSGAQNQAEAFRWFKKSAGRGNVAGMFNVGLHYYYGDGVRKDDGEAVRWFRKAANAGHALAMEYLGECYATGKVGGTADFAEAGRWFRKAAQAGNDKARERWRATERLLRSRK